MVNVERRQAVPVRFVTVVPDDDGRVTDFVFAHRMERDGTRSVIWGFGVRGQCQVSEAADSVPQTLSGVVRGHVLFV